MNWVQHCIRSDSIVTLGCRELHNRPKFAIKRRSGYESMLTACHQTPLRKTPLHGRSDHVADDRSEVGGAVEKQSIFGVNGAPELGKAGGEDLVLMGRMVFGG